MPIKAHMEPTETALYIGRDQGMFSVFFDVLSLLRCYENGYFKEIKVDFTNIGQFYEPAYGLNWWEYYFEPINNQTKPITKEFFLLNPWQIEHYNTKEYNHYLIEKYIRIKPHVQAKIDSFITKHFGDSSFIIGIHYRGGDKVMPGSEAPRVLYTKAAEVIESKSIRFLIRTIKSSPLQMK